MKCYKCGNENEEGVFTCTNCGAPLEVTEELIQDAVSGNDVAIEAIYNITYQNVFEEAGVFVKDDDALSNVIISTYGQVFALLDKIKAPLALTNLLKQKANQNAMDYLKTASPEIFADEEYNEQAIQLPINKDATVDKNEFINSLKSVLNTPDYVTSMLVYGKGKSIDEVSKLFGISKSTVKARLKRANNEISGLDLKAIPPLFTLFGSLLKGSAPVVPSSAIVQVASVQGTTKSATIISEATKDATSTATKQVAKTAAKEAGKTVAKGAAKATAGKGIVGTVMAHKVAAGVVAASIAVGGTGAGVVVHNNVLKQQEKQRKAEDKRRKENFAKNKTSLEKELKSNSQGLTIAQYVEYDFDRNGRTEAIVAAYKEENRSEPDGGHFYLVYIDENNKAVWKDMTSEYNSGNNESLSLTFSPDVDSPSEYSNLVEALKLESTTVVSCGPNVYLYYDISVIVNGNDYEAVDTGGLGNKAISGDYFYGTCIEWYEAWYGDIGGGGLGRNGVNFIYQYKNGKISEIVGKEISTGDLTKYSNGQDVLSQLSGYQIYNVISKNADKTYIYINVYQNNPFYDSSSPYDGYQYKVYYLQLYVDGNELKYLNDNFNDSLHDGFIYKSLDELWAQNTDD